PLKVYLNEPLPWVLPPTANATLAQLTNYIPAQFTSVASGAYYRDASTFTEVYRYEGVIVQENCFDTMVHLPGAPIYGIGMQCAICTLVGASNVSLAYCQNNILAGKLMGHACIWTTFDTQTAALTFYYASMPVYDARLVWFKLVYRVLLTVYAVVQLWHGYYRHYWSLFADLRRLHSLDSEFKSIYRYQIYVGDPTSVMLSDPLLSAAFQVDIFLSTSEMIDATFRTVQHDDLLQSAFGVLYCMRMVWFVYCGMRYGTYVLKRLCWEHRVAPLDTTLIAISTMVVGTLINFLVGNTRFLTLYLWTNTWASNDDCAIELAPSAIGISVISMSSPILVSMGLVCVKKNHRRHSRGSSYRHLSIKQRVLFRFF
ncbi:hypothetical protein ACHHYP_01727, partial [Achlya hypogyna]